MVTIPEDSGKGGNEAEETAGSGHECSTPEAGMVPDSPSKQLPEQISFFSGNPSVEIVHGIMHLYKTK